MNDITLQDGNTPVDENLKPVKIGGKGSSLELAQNGDGAKINGELEVTTDIKCNEVNVEQINSQDLVVKVDGGSILLDKDETRWGVLNMGKSKNSDD